MASFCLDSYRQSKETGFYYLQSRYYDPIVKRFLNADSYGSTGQGFLGYNMFAYCENNPVNFRDDSGKIPFWVLIAKKVLDWGLAHRLVQKDIESKYFGTETEVYVDRNHYRGGRVDVYQNGLIWEVKSEGSAALALPQASTYLECKLSDRAEYVKKLGPAGAFNGTIALPSFYGYDYVITYNTPQRGVIIYSVDEIKPAKQEAAEPVAAKMPVPAPSTGGAFIPIIIPGGPAYAFCPDPSCGHGLPGNRDPWTLDAY